MLATLKHWLPDFVDRSFVQSLTASLIFLVLLLLLRMLVNRAILKRGNLEAESKRRWLAAVRNTTVLVFLAGILFLWGRELQTLAVSMVAIAAAIVLATREMFLCLMGTIYRAISNAYSVGDRIEINGMRGLVIDTTLLSTTLLESTRAYASKDTVGRTVTVPNSLLLTLPVFNEARLGSYIVQTVHISLGRSEDWQLAERAMMAEASAIVAAYADDLRRHARQLERAYALETPTLEPRMRVSLDDRETIHLRLQLPAPLGRRARIEQRILRAYLLALNAAKNADGATDESGNEDGDENRDGNGNGNMKGTTGKKTAAPDGGKDGGANVRPRSDPPPGGSSSSTSSEDG